jgi:hypothetical protein
MILFYASFVDERRHGDCGRELRTIFSNTRRLTVHESLPLTQLAFLVPEQTGERQPLRSGPRLERCRACGREEETSHAINSRAFRKLNAPVPQLEAIQHAVALEKPSKISTPKHVVQGRHSTAPASALGSNMPSGPVIVSAEQVRLQAARGCRSETRRPLSGIRGIIERFRPRLCSGNGSATRTKGLDFQ